MTIAYEAPLGGISQERQARRAAIAGSVSSIIQWYDLFLAAALSGVMVRLSFPQATVGSTAFIAFLVIVPLFARVLGAVIFGHFGDRIGRKWAVIMTLLLMSSGTFALSITPRYEDVGIVSAIWLVALRLIQGIAIGGALTGNVLLPMEWAKPSKTGSFASWPQIGMPAGFALAQASVLVLRDSFGDEFFVWGWRVLFAVAGGAGLFTALWIRDHTDETPVFSDLRGFGSSPVLTAIRQSSKAICLVAVVRISELLVFFVFTGFLFTYPPLRAALPLTHVLEAILAACIGAIVFIPVFGTISDRAGRLPLYLGGAMAVLVWSFAAIALLQTAIPLVMLAAIGLSLIPFAIMVGPQAALIAESFTSSRRYSGVSLASELGALLATSLGPTIATMLLAEFKSAYAIAALLFVCVTAGAAAAIFLRPDEIPNRVKAVVETWIRSGYIETRLRKPPREVTETLSHIEQPTKAVRNSRTKLVLPEILRNLRTLGRTTVSEQAAIEPQPQRSSAPARRLNAWIDVPYPKVTEVFHLLINIGAPVAGAVGSEPLAELDWRGIESLELIVALTCIDCEIIPYWQKLSLPRTGDSATVKFKVLCLNYGAYDFTVRVFLAKQMIQLQSLSFSIAVEGAQVGAAS